MTYFLLVAVVAVEMVKPLHYSLTLKEMLAEEVVVDTPSQLSLLKLQRIMDMK